MAAEKEKSTCQLLVWKVPRALKKRFKLRCMRLDTTMKAQIIKMMERFLEKRP